MQWALYVVFIILINYPLFVLRIKLQGDYPYDYKLLRAEGAFLRLELIAMSHLKNRLRQNIMCFS